MVMSQSEGTPVPDVSACASYHDALENIYMALSASPNGQTTRVVTRGNPKDLETFKRIHSSDSESDSGSKILKLSSENQIDVNEPVPLFLTIKHRDEGKTLADVSPFTINKALVGAGGQPSSVKKLGNGTILVEAASAKQAVKILKMTKFYEKAPVSVIPHPSLNSSKGIVFSRDLLECSLEELKEELRSEHVTDVIRISRKENGLLKPTTGLILTFNTPKPPEKIKAGYLVLSVRPYFKNPQRCFKCQRFGHSSKVCPNAETCCRCSQTGHVDTDCNNEELCLNCKGKHAASSRNCKAYLEEKEILKIATILKIPFLEARKEFRKRQINTPKPDLSYSRVLAAPSQPTPQCSSCSLLEGMVRALTEQVAALVKQLSTDATKSNEEHSGSTTPAKALINKPSPQPKMQNAPTPPKKANTVPLSQESRKILQQKLKSNIASKVADRTKSTGKLSPQQSSKSSIIDEDMIEDDLQLQTQFNTLSGKLTNNQRKQKSKITIP